MKPAAMKPVAAVAVVVRPHLLVVMADLL